MTEKNNTIDLTPAAQLASYIDRLAPKHQKCFRSVRAALRKRFPSANELLYDYGKFFVISYSPSDHGIEGIFAVAARDTGVFLYFNQGQQLPDPQKILLGSGKQTRFIQVDAASRLSDPDVEAFIGATLDQAKIPYPSEGKGVLIVKSDASTKRSRRPAKA
ncbi:MAG: hypothetical protein V4582_18670 [Pseudomonadota bacterium]